jgi:methionine synthase II (cobalamin-independent)
VPKLTIPSPSMVHYRGGVAAIDESLYPELDEFWADLVAAYREEVRRVAELGCTYLQFDDTSLAYINDPKHREHVRAIGGDAEHQHEAYIRHINEALADRPRGLAVTTHMCRGNFRSSWRPRAATTSSPRRCSASSTSTASSWSGTTPVRAASSRCASSRRARWWSSAS